MGQGPPELLEDLLELGLGVAWPKSDEDKLGQAEQAWNKAANDFDAVITDLRAAGAKAHESLQGAPQQAFDTAWAPYIGRDGQAGLLSDLHDALTGLGTTCDNMSTEVSAAKAEFAADVAIQGAAILAQFAAGFFDFGVSDATGTAELVSLRGTLVAVLRALEAKIGAFLTRVLVDAAFGAVFSFVQDTVNQAIEIGYGERTGFDWGEAGTQAGLGAATGAGGALLRGGVGRVTGYDPTSLQGFRDVGVRALTDGAAANAVYDSYAAANGQSVDPMTVLTQFTSAGTQGALGDHANDLGDRIATRLGRKPPSVPDLTGNPAEPGVVGADEPTSPEASPEGVSEPPSPYDATSPSSRATVAADDGAAPVLTAGLGERSDPQPSVHAEEQQFPAMSDGGEAPSRFAWITRKTTPDLAPIPEHAVEPTALAHEEVQGEAGRPSAHAGAPESVSPVPARSDHVGTTDPQRLAHTGGGEPPTRTGDEPAVTATGDRAGPAPENLPTQFHEGQAAGPGEPGVVGTASPSAVGGRAPDGSTPPVRGGSPPGLERTGAPTGGHRDLPGASVTDGPSEHAPGLVPSPGHRPETLLPGSQSPAHHAEPVSGQPPDIAVVPVLVGHDVSALPGGGDRHTFGEAPAPDSYDALAAAPVAVAQHQQPNGPNRPAPAGYTYFQRPGWHRARDAAPVFTRDELRIDQMEEIRQPNQAGPGTPITYANGDPWGYGVRARYDARRFHFDGDTYTEITVRLHLSPDPGVSADSIATLKSVSRQGVEDYYNAPGHRLNDGARLHVRLEYVDDPADAHAQIRVQRNVYTFTRAGKRIFNLDRMQENQFNWYSGTVGVVAAHEVGHHLGLFDEYVDKVDPSSPQMDANGNPVWRRSISRANPNSPGVRFGPGIMGDSLQIDRGRGIISARNGAGLTVENIDQLSREISALVTWSPPATSMPPAPLPPRVWVNQSGTGNHGPPGEADPTSIP